ncbi:2791_t:CDS:2, partial [Scutellospora calospora]
NDYICEKIFDNLKEKYLYLRKEDYEFDIKSAIRKNLFVQDEERFKEIQEEVHDTISNYSSVIDFKNNYKKSEEFKYLVNKESLRQYREYKCQKLSNIKEEIVKEIEKLENKLKSYYENFVELVKNFIKVNKRFIKDKCDKKAGEKVNKLDKKLLKDNILLKENINEIIQYCEKINKETKKYDFSEWEEIKRLRNMISKEINKAWVPKNKNSWWDNYGKHEIVLLDEFQTKIDLDELIYILEDDNPQVQQKFRGFILFLAKYVFLTSIKSFDELYKEYDDTYELYKLIDYVIEFKDEGIVKVHKGNKEKFFSEKWDVYERSEDFDEKIYWRYKFTKEQKEILQTLKYDD